MVALLARWCPAFRLPLVLADALVRRGHVGHEQGELPPELIRHRLVRQHLGRKRLSKQSLVAAGMVFGQMVQIQDQRHGRGVQDGAVAAFFAKDLKAKEPLIKPSVVGVDRHQQLVNAPGFGNLNAQAHQLEDIVKRRAFPFLAVCETRDLGQDPPLPAASGNLFGIDVFEGQSQPTVAHDAGRADDAVMIDRHEDFGCGQQLIRGNPHAAGIRLGETLVRVGLVHQGKGR